MKLKIYLILFCVFPAGVKLYAQSNPYNEVSIASPTAASLGKYADVPVNAHTGIPQISIPIYTIKEGTLTLPISISYHAGGLKVLETAGWVGTGWSLNAGGVITRTVQGAPDERQTSSIADQAHGYLSDSGMHKYLWKSSYPVSTGLTSPNSTFSEMQDWSKFAEGRKDGEPDLFFFNVSGYSGKFFIRDDGKAVLFPEQDVRIEYNYTPGMGQSIASFMITTPDGTKYYFGETLSNTDTDPIEKTNPLDMDGGLSQGQVISSWYLNRIVSADNIFSISLTYQPESYGFYTISMFPIKYTETAQVEYKLIKNIVNGVRLSAINFSYGKVEFKANTLREDLNGTTNGYVDDANAESKRLDMIDISDSLNQHCKRFAFSYDYYFDGSSPLPGNFSNYGFNIDRKRLKLLSVQEQSCDGSIVIPAHQFEYYTDFVPRRLSFGMDHWGFYNGIETNNSLIPTYTLNDTSSMSGADRDSYWPAMRAGAIKKIVYPTKGFTEFEFENNSTWVNYPKKIWKYQYSISAGYDGSTNWSTMTQYFTENIYKVNFANLSALGSQAFLEIYRQSDNNLMGSWVLEPQKSISIVLSYAEGNYMIKIKKLTQGYTGHGATASFSKLVNDIIQKNEIVGGLRIKTLIHNDGISSGNNIITNYSYEVNGQSNGTLYSRPAYVHKVRNDILAEIGFQTGVLCPLTGETGGCTSCGGSAYVKSGAGIRPMGTTQGNHIGYDEVKISQTGNGYTIKRFYGSEVWDINNSDVAIRNVNTVELCPLTITNFPFKPLSYDYKRGESKYEGQFNEAGQLLKEIWFTHQYSIDPIRTPCFIAAFDPLLGGNGALGTFYTIETQRKVNTQITETLYTQNSGSIQTTNATYFESEVHTQPTRKVSSNSTGAVLETKYKYAFDYRISSCDQVNNCEEVYLSELNQAETQYLSNQGCGSHSCRWWAWQVYIKALSNARNKYVTARYANYTGSNNAASVCLNNSKNNSDAWLKPILELQQQNYNAPIEMSTWKGGKLLSASYNKYEYAVSPGSAVYPVKTFSINLASPSASFTTSAVNGNSIQIDSRFVQETSAQFLNGNIVEITPRNGITTSYLWDIFKAIPIAKAVGTNYSTLSNAFIQSSNNIITLRNHSSLANALVNTYEYHPFIGLTKEYDPNGKTLLYEYDKLQRLIMVRDQQNFILKRICYGYAGQPADCNVFYSIEKQGAFTKNNCPDGQAGSQVTYTVPPGAYVSTISQQDANDKAQIDINNNGQSHANNNGTCIGSSISVQGYNAKWINYNVKFTNTVTGSFYIFPLTADTYDFSTLGQVPAGTYNVQFYKQGPPVTSTFVVNGFTLTGGGATFYNISINATTSAYMY